RTGGCTASAAVPTDRGWVAGTRPTACTQVWNDRLFSPLSCFFLWRRREPAGGEEAAMLTSLGHFGDERLAKGGPFCCSGCARWACTAFACAGWAARARVRCGLGGC